MFGSRGLIKNCLYLWSFLWLFQSTAGAYEGGEYEYSRAEMGGDPVCSDEIYQELAELPDVSLFRASPNEPPAPLQPRDVECFADLIGKTATGQRMGLRKGPLISAVALRIAPHLNEVFKRYKINTRGEQAHFLAQMMYESYGFQLFGELVPGAVRTPEWQEFMYADTTDIFSPKFCEKYKTMTSTKAVQDFFNVSFSAPVPVCQAGQYSEPVKLISSHSYMYQWRGRGMIHLTHCYNYVMYAKHRAMPDTSGSSSVQYVDRRGKTQTITDKNSSCSQDQLADLIAHYRKKGVDLDKDGLLTRPDNLSDICRPDLLADSAAWFWARGANSCHARASADLQQVPGPYCNCAGRTTGGPAPCRPVKSEKRCDCSSVACLEDTKGVSEQDAKDIARVAALTRCVNGKGCYGLIDRYAFFRAILSHLASDRRSCGGEPFAVDI